MCRVSETSHPGASLRFVPGVEVLGALHTLTQLRKRLDTAPLTPRLVYITGRVLPPQVPTGLPQSVSRVGAPGCGPEAHVAELLPWNSTALR